MKIERVIARWMTANFRRLNFSPKDNHTILFHFFSIFHMIDIYSRIHSENQSKLFGLLSTFKGRKFLPSSIYRFEQFWQFPTLLVFQFSTIVTIGYWCWRMFRLVHCSYPRSRSEENWFFISFSERDFWIIRIGSL